MYLVYLLPLFLIVLVALLIFTGPVLALVVFVLFLLTLGAYKLLGRGRDAQHAPSGEAKAREEETGIWGEQRPS